MKIEGLKTELQKELQNIESLIEMKSRRSGEKGIMLVFEYQRILSRLRKVIQEEQISDSPTMNVNDLRAAFQTGFPPEGVSSPDEHTLDFKRKPTIAEFDEALAEEELRYGQEGVYVMSDSVVVEYGKQSDHNYLKHIHLSTVKQQPSGAVIKLKSREHAIGFIEKKLQSFKWPRSRCIFWLNGDITIDLDDPWGGSYKGFFNNHK